MTIRRLLLVAFILSALAASGCSSAGPYFRNRAADFADIFIAELTMGPYADVHANVTEYLGSALGFSVQRGGMLYRGEARRGMRVTIGVVAFAVTDVQLRDPGDDKGAPFETDRAWLAFLPMSWPISDAPSGVRKWPDNLNVELGGSFIYVGAHAGISGGQLLDFLLGWTTLDVACDDRCGEPPPEPEALPVAETAAEFGVRPLSYGECAPANGAFSCW